MLQNLQQWKFNPFKFSKLKYLRAVQFIFTMYQKLCKTNVSSTLYVLSSIYDSTVEWEEKEINHEKIEHCIIVIYILLWQFVYSAYASLKCFWKYPQDPSIHVHNISPRPATNIDKNKLIILPR